MSRKEALHPDFDPVPPEDLQALAAWVRGFSTAHYSARVPHIGETPARYAATLPTLYLDTTIVSYLTARPSRDPLTAHRQQRTRTWWHDYGARHICYVSELVREEARRGDRDAVRRRNEVLELLAKLHVTSQVDEFAKRVLQACRLPERVYDDAQHVAICALNGIEVLLTWNCSHLANPHMIPHIRQACEAYGYAAPDIHTPDQLIGVCAYGRSDS
jgi:predicted nucleic acid-binding protein